MRRALVSLAFGSLLSIGASAHHGSFEYDMDTVRRYEGVIVEHLWRNPHNLIVLETESETGEPLRLEIEGNGPSGLRPVGVSGREISVGERVTAIVSPNRRFPNQAFGHEIIKQDGRIVPLSAGSAYARARQSDTSASTIFGTWATPLQEFRRIFSLRKSYVLTDKGRGAADTYALATAPQAQCVAPAAPWLMLQPVVHEVKKLADRVTIRTDWLGGVERTIYMDGRDHPPEDRRFPQGHSVGRWEGDVLVVETTNFTAQVYASMPSSESKHLSERWAVSESGKGLEYSFVLEDPEYLAQPLSGTFQWDFRPDLEISGAECDPELAARYLQELP